MQLSVGGTSVTRHAHWVRRCAVSVAVTVIAWESTLAMARELPAPNYLSFAAAVAVATWYGGPVCGVLASVLSVAAIDFSFLPPISRVEFTHAEELLDMAAFLVVALTIGATSTALRRARLLAEESVVAAARANRELQHQMEEVQRLSSEVQRAREDTLNAVAHDLRNPLHVMAAAMEILEDGEIPISRRRELAAIGHRAVKQMRRLIDDLLESARLQAGALSLDLSAVSLGEVVTQAVEMFLPIARERRIRLVSEVASPELCICADSQRIQQVLGNLLSNALKFTPPDREVIVRTAVEGNNAVLKVVDSGPGIRADDVPRLFEPFWQKRRGDRRGIGLGLKIAKGIVEAHRGHLAVESTPRVGSTFSFTLPLIMDGPCDATVDGDGKPMPPSAREDRDSSSTAREAMS